ncbi:potassium channel family protein [Reyranella sp.]|uniref:potassium channel family protein n=1 Tax=Reyranella sp. TaxID=1929291 RepID=UPI003BA852B2
MPLTSRPLLRRIAFLRRNRCSALLAALCVFILFNPFVAESTVGALVLALGTIGILLLALWALRAPRRTLVALGLLALATLYGIAADRFGEHWLRPATLFATAVFMGAVTGSLLLYVLDWHPITTDKVFGAVAAYVLIAFTFACLFGLLQQLQPHSFHAAPIHAPENNFDWATMMYFSFTVLTSTGFGEITPVSRMARSLIVIEQVLGVMYVAFLVARLANLYGRRSISDQDR